MEIFCEALIVLSLITFQAPVQEPSAPGHGVFRVGKGVAPPVLLSKTEPEYSEQARKARYQGSVMLYVQIDPSGEPTNIKVVRALGLGLDQKAMEAIAKWKFRPGSKEGNPVTVEATIEVSFRLSGEGWAIARNDFTTAAGASKPVLKAVASPPKCKSSDSKLTLSLTVHADGSVGKVHMVSSTEPSLNHGVMDSVKKWTFVPALQAGVPQSVDGQIDVVCSLTHMH
jgi:TonB family protein